jgi:nicotinamide mononucleotide transporter
MINPWEIAANLFNAASILLAGRNSVHTWWTGIVGSVLFTWVFFASKLYADTTLQLFFIATSIAGWWNWRRGLDEADKPVLRTGARALLPMIIAALAVAAGYALLLRRFTDAYAPVPDSLVLTFSVLGQFLLMGRRLETWWCWLLVNAIATPLYFSRGLHLTAALYAVFWVNALVSLRHWRRLQAHA